MLFRVSLEGVCVSLPPLASALTVRRAETAALRDFNPANVRFGSILLKKDFEGATSATLIQGERRTSNIDLKIHLLGFVFHNPIPQIHFGYFVNSIDPKMG